MEHEQASPVSRRSPIVASFVATVLGGIVCWTCVFVGIGISSLAVGVGAIVTALAVYARSSRGDARLGLMAGFSVAFLLLTWFPLLWLAVGYVRYLITGETLGD